MQFTREEEGNNSIAFLDVFVTRHEDGTLTSRIFRKPPNTNICIKPQSCQDPNTSIASFKGELCRCHRTSQDQIKKEIDYTLDLYEDNGHNREKLKHIAANYTPSAFNQQMHKEKPRSYKAKQTQAIIDSETKSLFDELPFCNFNITQDEIKPFASIKYIPGISHQIRASLKKAGVSTNFTSGTSLKNILCGKNKTQAPKEKKAFTSIRALAQIKQYT